MGGLRMEACANDHSMSSNATLARDRSNYQGASPDWAYGFGCFVKRAYVADYATHKLPNDPAEARQNILALIAWRGNDLSLRDITSSNASFILAFRFFFVGEVKW